MLFNIGSKKSIKLKLNNVQLISGKIRHESKGFYSTAVDEKGILKSQIN